MSKAITITSPSGVTLKTKNKYMDDDVAVQVDGAENIVAGNIKSGVSILGVECTLPPAPSGTLEITENGTYNVASYASADVNVSSAQENPFKTLIDATGSAQYMFYNNKSLTNEILTQIFDYNTTENLKESYNMFYGCTNLTDIPNINLSKLNYANSMFANSGITAVIDMDLSAAPARSSGYYPDYGNMFYYTKVTSVQNTFKFPNYASMSSLFSNCTDLVSADLTIVAGNSSGYGYTMSSTFSGCNKLENARIHLSGNSMPSDIGGTYASCSKLIEASIEAPDNVYFNGYIRQSTTFYGCPLLQTAYLHMYCCYSDYSNYMFCNCYSITKIIFRKVNTSSFFRTLPSGVFTSCYHLTGTVNATYNPNGDKDCYIYVPDDMVDTLKEATNWSVYADQIKGLSELPQTIKEKYNIT
jgi:hypothetical protein